MSEHEHHHEHTHEHTHADGTTHCHPHEHEHTHTHGEDHGHTHEHLHAEGVPHEHSHEHTHDHDHPHTHDHEHTHDHGPEQGSASEQLYALMKYMAGHNAAHTRELEDLAAKAQAAGNAEGYDLIMEAVRFFDQGNESLAKALEKFAPEK